MTEKSLRCVIAILKGEKPNDTPDWYDVLGFLLWHRIAGLFYSRAKRQNFILPMKVEKILAETYEKQRRKVSFMRRQIAVISERLIADRVKHIFLKGSVLTNLSSKNAEIYTDGERISNDIDILVKPNGITAASKVLFDLGFVQGKYDEKENRILPFSRSEILKRRMNRGEVAPFIKLTGNQEFPYIEVDINFSLGNTPDEGKELLLKMIDSAQTYGGKVRLCVPDEELFFLHLIMHQYKESCLLFMVEQGKDLDLYKLADIYYLLQVGTFDEERLKWLAKEYEIESKVGLVLHQVGQIFENEKICQIAAKYGYVQPQVLDYDKKKAYEWSISVKERMCLFDSRAHLKEVKIC